ncbi:MAG TPA: haloacid dehalogenase-like hydrolase, partial [Terriglobales bacterium]|nr:haloacid dehalogenase-like hydrolase [Terriglobales bacterium]
MRLFLFDIDGTLIVARGAGREAFNRALRAVYGTAGPEEGQYDFRGKTDPRILLDLMTAAGLSPGEIAAGAARFYETYVEELAAVIGDGRRVTVMPGIADVVRALARREDAVVGLLTGNIEGGARVKLAPTGLWPLFRLGAYGSDHIDRRELPAVACARARQVVGHDFSFDRVTIIGDTPLDVDCARACGARAVAVATGFHPYDDLEGCAPDLLFQDFA